MGQPSIRSVSSLTASGAGIGATSRRNWDELPEERLLAQETLAVSQRAIDALPPAQRAVILLRDVDGLSAAEVCNVLQISESNQRVLLHRARAKVQNALARYLSDD
jgi:RNA polymerase sigma-70 factor (ECF subfamily)